jgi:hypothetical protein
MWESPLKIIDCLSKQCYIVTEQVFLGVTYHQDLGIFVLFTLAERRWSKTGVWEQVFEHLAEDADNEYAMIDSTIVRAHQHSAGAKGGDASTEAIGRSFRRINYQDSCCGGCAGQPTQFPLDTWASLRS